MRQAAICEVANALTRETLSALADGEILAISLPGFYPAEACAIVATRVHGTEPTRYDVAPSVAKLGMALFEATDARLLERYYEDARGAAERAARLYRDVEDPIDRVRAILKREWRAGCEIERLHQREMHAGLVRIIDQGTELRPHQDNTDWDMPDCPRAQDMRAQLSCNIYFAVPQRGGELELWDYAFDEEPRYRQTQVSGDYSLDRTRIGPPAMVLKPRLGELIVFNARRIHAVAQVLEGTRINASTFIALRGEDEPLTLFS